MFTFQLCAHCTMTAPLLRGEYHSWSTTTLWSWTVELQFNSVHAIYVNVSCTQSVLTRLVYESMSCLKSTISNCTYFNDDLHFHYITLPVKTLDNRRTGRLLFKLCTFRIKISSKFREIFCFIFFLCRCIFRIFQIFPCVESFVHLMSLTFGHTVV